MWLKAAGRSTKTHAPDQLVRGCRNRLGHREGAASALDDWAVDKLAAEGDRAFALRLRRVERCHHDLAVLNFLGSRAEGAVDRVDLPRMDQRLAGEAEAPALQAVAVQPGRVLNVRP